MEATDARGIYTPSQAILYKSHRMFLRKIQVREGSRGRLLRSHKPAREEQRPNEQKGTVGGEGGRAANPQGERGPFEARERGTKKPSPEEETGSFLPHKNQQDLR